jgi:hypothetical protein
MPPLNWTSSLPQPANTSVSPAQASGRTKLAGRNFGGILSPVRPFRRLFPRLNRYSTKR